MSIEIVTSFVFLMSALYGNPMEVAGTDKIMASSLVPDSQSVISQQPMAFEDFVKEYYKEKPILYEIAKCESTLRHWNSEGEVLRGRVNKSDVGLMQINEAYHAKTAKALGFDLTTIKGNMAYAEWLYEKQGTAPWVHSSKCWKDKAVELAVK